MELHVVETEGIPEGCVLSVRAGATRRQAPVSSDRPFRFNCTAAEATPFKVDVLEPVATARLILRPGEEKRTDCQYTIPLEASNSFEGSAPSPPASPPQGSGDMFVTIAVSPSDEAQEEQQQDTSDKGNASAASRIGQASAAREYLDKHNLVEFTQLLVQSVIKEQPEKPYEFMARQFYFPEPEPRPRPPPMSAEDEKGRLMFGVTMATVGGQDRNEQSETPGNARPP